MMVRSLIALAAILAAGGLRAEEPAIAEWSVPPYTIVLKTDPAARQDDLRVESGGKTIYHLSDQAVRSELTLGPETVADDRDQSITGHDAEDDPGHDALGLGFPNLVFSSYSGGAHCCFTAIILMLDKPFRVQTIELYDAGGYFHPVDGRKSQVLEATDATFKEWRASPADSPFPTVILSFDRAAGRYAADADLMRAPLPAPDELARQKERARTAHETAQADGLVDYEPYFLTGPLLDLIYGGHMREAHDFLVEAWSGDAARGEAYWSLLTRCKLRTGPYWPAVAKVNGLAADPPAKDCPR